MEIYSPPSLDVIMFSLLSLFKRCERTGKPGQLHPKSGVGADYEKSHDAEIMTLVTRPRRKIK